MALGLRCWYKDNFGAHRIYPEALVERTESRGGFSAFSEYGITSTPDSFCCELATLAAPVPLSDPTRTPELPTGSFCDTESFIDPLTIYGNPSQLCSDSETETEHILKTAVIDGYICNDTWQVSAGPCHALLGLHNSEQVAMASFSSLDASHCFSTGCANSGVHVSEVIEKQLHVDPRSAYSEPSSNIPFMTLAVGYTDELTTRQKAVENMLMRLSWEV